MIKFKELRVKLQEADTDAGGLGGGGGGGGGAIQIPGQNQPTLDDGTHLKAIYNIGDEQTRAAINSFIASEMNEKAYLNPKQALVHLRTKLNIVGLNFDLEPSAIETTIPEDGIAVEEGTVEEYDLTGFGGMQGMNMDGQFVKDDGIASRAGTPMVLRVEYTEGQNRLHHLNAEIVAKSGMEDVED